MLTGREVVAFEVFLSSAVFLIVIPHPHPQCDSLPQYITYKFPVTVGEIGHWKYFLGSHSCSMFTGLWIGTHPLMIWPTSLVREFLDVNSHQVRRVILEQTINSHQLHRVILEQTINSHQLCRVVLEQTIILLTLINCTWSPWNKLLLLTLINCTGSSSGSSWNKLLFTLINCTGSSWNKLLTHQLHRVILEQTINSH